MSTLNNPFTIEGYVSARYFCDREEESATLEQALESNRNVTLISPRRMGKSGLIHHVFERLRAKDPNNVCYYIDIYHTRNLKEFVETFAETVFHRLDTPMEKLLHTVTTVLKSCRPSIGLDAITSMPTLTLAIDPGQEGPTLRQIFEYLKSSQKRIYIAFDEFQQIAEYTEKNVEALLRSFIQFSPNISFVFAGSKKHLMQEMFLLSSRPFYQSTQTMSLGSIPEDKYFEFAQRLFAQKGMQLDREAFAYIYSTVFGHTWYVQYWCSMLYDLDVKKIDTQSAAAVMEKILREEDDNFYTYTKLVTESQLRVLRAIAKERTVSAPISIEVVKRHDLPAPSTVRSCIKSLLQKELLLDQRDVYSVYNRFFMLWLAKGY